MRQSARIYPAQGLTMRQAEGDGGAGPDGGRPGDLIFEGYASVTEHEYPVYGGEWPGWMETIAADAFDKTLAEGADVAFLVNHGGMTLARTKSGTLDLSVDERGEHVRASLDPTNNAVTDLRSAVNRGDIDEMSFAFRVVRDEWFDDDGEPSDWLEGTRRRILEINQHKGDVSAVNYGANDATSAMLRDGDTAIVLDRAGGTIPEPAMAELRAGHPLAPEQIAALRGTPRQEGETVDDVERLRVDLERDRVQHALTQT